MPAITPEKQRTLLQSILDHMGEAVIVADKDFRILLTNPAAHRIFGWKTEGAPLQANPDGLYLTDQETPFPRTDLPLERAIRGESVEELQMFVRPPGIERGTWVSTTGRPLRDAAGNVVGGLIVCRDITERRQAEDTLRRSVQMIEDLYNRAPCGYHSLDPDGRYLRVNDTELSWLGHARHELLGKKMADLMTAESREAFERQFPAFKERGWVRDLEFDMVCKDGKRLSILLSATAVKDDAGRFLMSRSTIFDITERKLAQKRLGLQYMVAEILAEGRTLAEIAGQILNILGPGVDCDFAAVWVVDAEQEVIRCLETWCSPAVSVPEFEAMTRKSAFARGVGLPGHVWQTGEACALDNCVTHPNFPRAVVAGREGLQGGFAFPIVSAGEAIGVIEFFQRAYGRPSDDLLKMMAALGNQIGQVLERQHVTRALEDSEAVYHSLVECLPQNIFRKDREGRITFANQRYCATMKRPLAELLGKTDFDLFPQELAAKYVRDDQRVLETGIAFEDVERHHLPDGGEIYVQVVKTPILNADGEIIGTQGIFWDVTERKRAEQAVLQSERRYRQLTEATQDGIVLAEQDGTIALFNPAAERIFGYSAEEVVGKPIRVLMPAEYHDGHEKGFQRYLQTRQPRVVGRVVELKGRRKDGKEFPLELSLSAVKLAGPTDSEGRPPVQFLAAMRDVTERNRIRAVLLHKEKLISIGQMSAGMAHEINNPLAFIANNLAVLERDNKGLMALVDLLFGGLDSLAKADPDLAARARLLAEEVDLAYLRDNLPRLVHRTREGVERVTRLVQSLRSLARTDAPKKQEANLQDIIGNNLEIIRGQLRKTGIEVEQKLQGRPILSCVPSQINQVLLNIFINAIHAIEGTRRKDGKISIRTRDESEELLIEIEDNGCGIREENLVHIFDPFFTTKDVGEGTGLGLSISHDIIVAHGGRIEVDSHVGEGTCFSIYLPVTSRETP